MSVTGSGTSSVIGRIGRRINDLGRQPLELGFRQLAAAVHEAWTPPDGDELLVIPCGTGLLRWLWPGRPWIGVDLDRVSLSLASSRLEHPADRLLWADVRALPLEEDAYRWVFSHGLLHHLDDGAALAALLELARVTERELLLVDLVRGRRPWQRMLARLDAGHWVRSAEDLTELVSQALEVVDARAFDSGVNRKLLLRCRPRR